MKLKRQQLLELICMHGRWKGAGGQGRLILKILAKKVVFLFSSGKKQILSLLVPHSAT